MSLARVAGLRALQRPIVSIGRVAMARPALRSAPAVALRMGPSFQAPSRFYSDASLTREFVQERIFEVLGTCDKFSVYRLTKIVDPSKITATANFSSDLGLDSLDVVDALFFIEEEFNIEIPDHEADEIHTVGQAIDYILAQPDAF